MPDNKITLTLPWPPSINHYYVRSLKNVFINKKGKEFRKNVFILTNKLSGFFSFEDRLSLNITLNPPNKRKFDLDNRLKGLLDSLEYAQILPNDEQIDILVIKRGNIVKDGNACIEIAICNGQR